MFAQVPSIYTEGALHEFLASDIYHIGLVMKRKSSDGNTMMFSLGWR